MEFLPWHRHDRQAGRALAEIYREHSAAAYRFAFHLTGSREDAEDLVQVAFLQAHRTLTSGEVLVNPRAWLATVIRRRAVNAHRDSREEAASDRLDVLAGQRDDQSDAGAELDRIRVVLHSLPEAQHQAFVLRYWSDLSYREIASVLDTTESAVESLLVRARAAVIARPEVSDECIDVHRRLSAEAPLAPLHERHLGACPRCRAARTRLARAAGIAAAVALIPRMHVAQALAASAPGFSVAGATGAGAAGGTSAVFGKAAAGLKATLLAGAIAGSVAGVHARLDTGSPRHDPAAPGPAAAMIHASPAPASDEQARVRGDVGSATVSAASAAGRPRGHTKRRASRLDDGQGSGGDAGAGDTADGAQQVGEDQGGDEQSNGGDSAPVSENGSANGASNDDNSSKDDGSSNDNSSSGGGNQGGNS